VRYHEPPISATEQELRLLNGTLNKYLIGLAWHLGGFNVDQINEQWDWGANWDYNQQSNHAPGDALLNVSRVPSALPVAGGVGAIGVWLQTGEVPPGAQAASTVFEKDLLAQWNAGDISLHATEDLRLVRLLAKGRVGLFLGYRQAPVVIAESTGNQRRLAVGQFERGWIDMTQLLDQLAALEPGWGGSATLIACPHGADTRLNSAEVEARVLGCLGSKSRAEV